jgi:glycosyltransferase involved in cell wall biosynthesis
LLRREKFDVAICHSCWPHLVFAPAVRDADCPLVFWAHGVASDRDRQARWAMRTRPDLVLMNSEFTKKASALPSDVRCEVLRYPVALSSVIEREPVRRQVRESLGAKMDAVVIVMVSRLERWKGHRLLLEALAMLKETPNWECWIAGGAQRASEEAYLAELHRAAEDGGISGRVRFLGERRDVANLLAAADVHCQPNTEPEPFGITFVEALYAGLPVVTTSMGAAMEIVDESCGRVVRPDDAGALAGVLAEMICNGALRSRLGEAGPARATALCDVPARLNDLKRLLEGVVR